MEILAIGTILAYMLSTTSYFAFLIQQKKVLNQIGFALLLAGFVLNSSLIGYNLSRIGHFPVHDLQGTLLIAGWAVAGIAYVGAELLTRARDRLCERYGLPF